MIVPVNNNFSPLPFYKVDGNELDNKYLQSNKPYAYGAVFDMPIAGGWLMPFQFSVDFEVFQISSAFVIPIDTPSATEGLTAASLDVVYDQDDGKSTIMFYGEQHGSLPVGRMYIEIELIDASNSSRQVYMSDIFNNVRQATNNQHVVPDGYIRLTYNNDHYLRYNGGKIYFGYGKFDGFDILIDTTIGKPNYTFEEKSSDRLGYRYIESQVSNKAYGFTFIAPEYLCDALRLLPMCNQRVITDKWHTYNQITDVNIDVEWLDQGDLAKVTITFNNDTVIANLAEYVSVAPTKLNTMLPVPPTPEVTLPRVIINALTDIQQTEATIDAEVVSDGGGTLTERGLCWSDSSTTPDIYGSHLPSAPAQLGQYTVNIQNLHAGTTYYVRAYATNEIGTAYSDTLVIETAPKDEPPQVLTYGANNVTDVTADVSGSVISEGTQPVTSRGIVISTTNQTPEIDDNDVSVYLDSGQGLGSFIKSFDNLTPSTTYYYRAFAISRVDTAYGEVMSFSTKGVQSNPPTVVTDATVRNLTSSGATIGGTVTNNGGGTIRERGVCLSTGSTPTISDTVLVDSQAVLGTYYVNATGLVANTTYYFRAYAINEAGVGYGDIYSFTTENNAQVPTVAFDQYGAGYNRMRLDAHVVSDNGSQIIQNGMGFRYSLMSDMSNPTSVVAGQVSGYSFGEDISGLQPETTYYCQAWATNSIGTGYSSVIAITTEAAPKVPPTVTVDPVDDEIDEASAYKFVYFECEVTDGGTHPVTQRGVCWSDSNNTPTISDNNQAALTAGVGQYTVSVRQINFVISDKIVYFYRAYAISEAGIGYSEVRSCRFHYAPTNEETP